MCVGVGGQDSVQTVQAMKFAGKELKTAMKRDELDISGIERMQDDMADVMVLAPPPSPLPARPSHAPLSFTRLLKQSWTRRCFS